jgi:hypothetical protein
MSADTGQKILDADRERRQEGGRDNKLRGGARAHAPPQPHTRPAVRYFTQIETQPCCTDIFFPLVETGGRDRSHIFKKQRKTRRASWRRENGDTRPNIDRGDVNINTGRELG